VLEQVFRPQATPYRDDQFQVTGSADATKLFKLEVDTQAAGKTLTLDVGAQTANRTATIPVLTASDTFAFLNVANTFTKTQTIDISATAGTVPTPIFASGTPSIFVGAVTNILEGVAWTGQGFRMIGRLAGGSRGADAATAANAVFLTLQAYGHDGTSFQTTQNAVWSMAADGLWSGTNRGVYHVWTATPNGSTAVAEWMRLTDACLLIGTTTKMTGVTGGLSIGGTTDATSTTTGASQNAGGSSIQKALFVGGAVNATSTTDSTSATSGGGIFSGGVGIAKNLVTSQGLGLGVTSTATAAGTTTLTTASDCVQIFTGTTTQNVTLPAANGFGAGQGIVFIIKNRSTGALTVNRAGSDTIEGATSLNISSGVTETLISNGVSEWERC
jgi:hypothetical protein